MCVLRCCVYNIIYTHYKSCTGPRIPTPPQYIIYTYTIAAVAYTTADCSIRRLCLIYDIILYTHTHIYIGSTLYSAIHSLAFTVLYILYYYLLCYSLARSLTSPGTPHVYSCMLCGVCVCVTDGMSGVGRVKAYYYFRACVSAR